MRVAVIRGGLQDVGIALELGLRGVSVDLFENRDVCLGHTSLQNEGKIHLGFIYAKDRSLATAQLMAPGSASLRTGSETMH
jgi:glycerol-3-phosphate dehydrogenase